MANLTDAQILALTAAGKYPADFASVLATIQSSSTYTYAITGKLSETINISSSITTAATLINSVSETAKIEDVIKFVIYVTVNETLTGSSSSVSLVIIEQAISEVIRLSETASNVSTMLALIQEFVQSADRILRGFSHVIKENVNLTDTVTAIYKWLVSVHESLSVTSQGNYTITINVIVPESINISDGISNKNSINLIINESLIFAGAINDGEKTYTFVLNTKTSGISEYSSFNFNSISNGMACSSDGIYRFSSTSTDIVQAEISTGKSTLGNNAHKQVPYAYLGITNSGDILLKTTTTQNGVDKDRYYKLAQTSEYTETRRVNLGKGVKSTRWQFSLESIDASSFTLESIDILPITLNRRI